MSERDNRGADKKSWIPPVEVRPEQLLKAQPGEPESEARPLKARMVDPDKATPVEPSEPDTDREMTSASTTNERRQRRSGIGRWFAAATALLLSSAVAAECYRLISWGYDLHSALGIGFSVLVASALGSGILWLLKCRRGLRQLKKTESVRQQADRLLDSHGQGQAAPVLQRLQHQSRGTALEPELQQAMSEVDSAYKDGEIIRFVSHHGFREADRLALERVGTHSLETAVMVGVSPFVSFDMLLIGWRNFRMLNEIAGHYGIAPGLTTQLRLLRQVLHNLAFAGISELAIDSGGALLGSSLTTQLSARAGQGLGAGLMTARVGLQTIQLCRPLPFDRRHQPKLGHIRDRILSQLKDKL